MLLERSIFVNSVKVLCKHLFRDKAHGSERNYVIGTPNEIRETRRNALYTFTGVPWILLITSACVMEKKIIVGTSIGGSLRALAVIHPEAR